jgi:hypothetical protein
VRRLALEQKANFRFFLKKNKIELQLHLSSCPEFDLTFIKGNPPAVHRLLPVLYPNNKIRIEG